MMICYVVTEPTADMFKAPYLMVAQEWITRPDNGLCPVCLHVDRSYYPRPLDVVLESLPKLPDKPMEDTKQESLFFANIQLTIWRRDFIEAIKEELKGFVIGRCLLPNGAVIENYVTCYSPEYVVVRGNRQSRYRICPRCQCVASEIYSSPRYILSRYLKGGPIFQDSACGLYVNREIGIKYPLLLKNFTISLDLITVRDAPADGQYLPGDEVDKTNSI